MAVGESQRRTSHGWQRHREKTRPTDLAFQDRDNPEEVYEQDDGRMIYVGKRRRVHVFEAESHLTSFRMSNVSAWQKLKKANGVK